SDFAAWIKSGAAWPATVANKEAFTPQKHWAFQPVTPVAPPEDPSGWARHPIDRFIAAKLRGLGLAPVGPADRRAPLRRVTFDLIGLPPTPEEIEALLGDASSGAFEKVVDRLLASPHYGERWGRHWLDVVRYADTSGDNSDFPVPSMFRYRNWVIAALNRDEPYDRFLREQLAGDILASQEDLVKKNKEEWQQKMVATGYLANSRRFGSRIAEFHLTIDDTIDNLGKGILGLTIGCARCHDHKFD